MENDEDKGDVHDDEYSDAYVVVASTLMATTMATVGMTARVMTPIVLAFSTTTATEDADDNDDDFDDDYGQSTIGRSHCIVELWCCGFASASALASVSASASRICVLPLPLHLRLRLYHRQRWCPSSIPWRLRRCPPLFLGFAIAGVERRALTEYLTALRASFWKNDRMTMGVKVATCPSLCRR